MEWKNLPVWLHGEIVPGTPLAHNGYLCGVIDFGVIGISDAAYDYAMPWSFLTMTVVTVFCKGETAKRLIGQEGGHYGTPSLLTMTQIKSVW